MNIETFFAATDLVVVGTNHDNPRGNIIRSAAFVYAEDARGSAKWALNNRGFNSTWMSTT